MKMTIETKSFPLETPFSITGYTFTDTDAVWVTLENGDALGRGEGVGMYYAGETAATMRAQLEDVKPQVEAGASLEDIQKLLPHGGARNALDCAYWDMLCKSEGRTIWDRLAISPKTLTTVATVGIGTPEWMADRARSYALYPNLKIKLSDDDPITRLRAIRAARPDASLVIDVNQGWSVEDLKTYLPALKDLGVAMIEQPLKRGADADLEGFQSDVPLGADESCLNLSEYEKTAPFYDVINIKLDKCGGLTEALALAKRAQADGKDVMVGNMTGSSLSMAPAYVIGQFCTFVDIDGPVLLQSDIENALVYGEGGAVSLPTPALWG